MDLLPQVCKNSAKLSLTDTCDQTTCSDFVGACFLPDQICLDGMSTVDCAAFGGAFQGNGVMWAEVQRP
ncbi:MAG: hypothetical protein MK101_11315 [Phycisphaerales bacterium]|nr:hypothetical protein [Phycisphaerales bacterium]